MKSTVNWYNDAKGYGFLNNNSNPDKPIFVHYTAIAGDRFKTLAEGQEVEFELIEGCKGLQASNVMKVVQS